MTKTNYQNLDSQEEEKEGEMKSQEIGDSGNTEKKPKRAAHQHNHDHELPWESAISGYAPAAHEHGEEGDEEVKHGIAARLNKLMDQIKSVDGIDETANLFGQILPGIGAPIATAAILGVATPFVWLGVMGMRHEYEEACEQFDEILHRQEHVQEKLYALRNFAQNYQKILTQRFGIELPQQAPTVQAELDEFMNQEEFDKKYGFGTSQNLRKNQEQNLTSLAVAVNDEIALNNKKIVAELGKKYGFTGIIGMAGMFAGMLPSTAASGLEIANEISTMAALEAASSALSIAGSSCFLVGQVAMSAYAVNRGRQGVLAKEFLQENAAKFHENIVHYKLSEASKKQIEEIFAKQIKFIEQHSIEYAKLTLAGQMAMMSGTALGLSGFGLVATVPLFAVGAPTTIYAAINRIIYQGKEQKFLGKEADENLPKIQENIDASNPIKLFSQVLSESKNSSQLHQNVLGKLDEKLQNQTAILAKLKVFSLLHLAVNGRNSVLSNLFKDGRLSSQKPSQRLQSIIDGFSKDNNSYPGTGLESVVVAEMREVFSQLQQDQTILNLMMANKNAANAFITNKVLETIGVEKSEIQQIGLSEHLKEKLQNPQHVISAQESREIITAAKNVAKKNRAVTADAICVTTQIIAAKEILRGPNVENFEQKKKKVVKSSNAAALEEEEIKLEFDSTFCQPSASVNPNSRRQLKPKSNTQSQKI